MSGWSSTVRILRLVVSPPSLPLTPRRHRHADGQLSSLYAPSLFGAACVKLCCLPPPSLVRNTHLCCLVYDVCRRYTGRFALNINMKSSIIFSDTVDAPTATFAVWTRPSSKGRSNATNHGWPHARQATSSLAHIVGEAWIGPNRWSNGCESGVRIQTGGEPLDVTKPCHRQALTTHAIRKCSCVL